MLCARALQHLGPVFVFNQELWSLLGHCEPPAHWLVNDSLQERCRKSHLLLALPPVEVIWHHLCFGLRRFRAFAFAVEGGIKEKKDIPCLSEGCPSISASQQGHLSPDGSDGACTGEQRFVTGSVHRGHFSWTKHISFQRAKTQARKKPLVCSAFRPDPHMLQELEMQLIMSDPFTLLEKLFIITIVLAWHLSPQ